MERKLHSRLAFLIREIGRELRRFTRNPDRNFNRWWKLSMETLTSALLYLEGGRLDQELINRFGQAPSLSPSLSGSRTSRSSGNGGAAPPLYRRTGNVGALAWLSCPVSYPSVVPQLNSLPDL